MRDILIVEDGYSERERLKSLFEGSSFSTVAVESAEEAERMLGAEQFRLVLLDIGLGNKSGSYLFDRIRRLPRMPHVIVLTGNPSIHLKQRFLDEGAAAYVVKASNAAENEPLLEAVQSLLGQGIGLAVQGLPLVEFLKLYVGSTTRELFTDQAGNVIPCHCCGGREFVVNFDYRVQLPPVIEGKVVCTTCRSELDPKVG